MTDAKTGKKTHDDHGIFMFSDGSDLEMPNQDKIFSKIERKFWFIRNWNLIFLKDERDF